VIAAELRGIEETLPLMTLITQIALIELNI
jgi:hypothetical protein